MTLIKEKSILLAKREELKVKPFLIDDWGILKKVVPGIESAIFSKIQELTGRPLEPCVGSHDTRGYREGTVWLHLIGLEKEVTDQIENVILIMSSSFRPQIEREKEAQRERVE